jgi:hypothetical protein
MITVTTAKTKQITIIVAAIVTITVKVGMY